MIPATTIADALESSLNAAVDLDLNLKRRVADLEGRALRFEITSDGAGRPSSPSRDAIRLTMCVADGRVRVASRVLDEADEVDAVVSGTAMALGELLLNGQSARAHVRGDQAVLDDFRHCFKPQLPKLQTELGKLFDTPVVEHLLGAAELGIAAVRSALEGLTSQAGPEVHIGYATQPELDDARERLQALARVTRQLVTRAEALARR